MRSLWTSGWVLLLLAIWSANPATQVAQTLSGATVYEGARLITGDGSAASENAAFIVENRKFTQVKPSHKRERCIFPAIFHRTLIFRG